MIRPINMLGLIILLIFCTYTVKAQHITLLQQGKPTSIRGLSIVDNNIAWISGSKGYIALTKDGGKTWAWQQVKGYEKSDFRAIQAFSTKEAIIMSSGTPALVLKTTDGGNTWTEKYKNTDTSYFLDAMDFADAKHGFILGDPINNKFVLLETKDAGETWQLLQNQPQALPGEAAFAASGTCLRVKSGGIDIATGGSVARHLYSAFPYKNWYDDYLPIKHGEQSQGAFSMDKDELVFVGGDYKNDKDTNDIACWYNPMLVSIKNGWQTSSGLSGYQSCVEWIVKFTYLSTGASGSNISTNNGKTWTKIDSISFNTCRKAKRGTLVLLAGNDGKIALFKP